MIKDIAKRLDFPGDAIESLSLCEESLHEYEAELIAAEESLFTPKCDKYLEILENISQKSGADRKAVDMVLMLRCAIPLAEKYREAGYSDQLFVETMADLRFKLMECKDIFGIWGTFVTPWFKGFYLLERFKIGRMQYERIEFPFDDYKGIVKKGDIVLSYHIPSDGHLLEEDAKESLREAYKFYENDRKNGKLAVMCFSWLLYSPIFADYKEGSNLKRFYNLFDVIENRTSETNSDFWRVFKIRYSPEALESIEADNSLKRAILDHIKSGGSMGSGTGIIIVDENY
jgi:hypothetical protein